MPKRMTKAHWAPRRTTTVEEKEERFANKFARDPVQDNYVHKVRLCLQSAATKISSNGATVVDARLSMDPSSSGDWASYASIYDEFRVVGVGYQFVSTQQYSVTTINQPIAVVFDNDDSTALTSYNAAMEYPSCRLTSAVFQSTAECTHVAYTWMRPTSGTPIPWVDVGAPSGSLGSIKFYGDSLSVGTQYFSGVQVWFVEFRGRR